MLHGVIYVLSESRKKTAKHKLPSSQKKKTTMELNIKEHHLRDTPK